MDSGFHYGSSFIVIETSSHKKIQWCWDFKDMRTSQQEPKLCKHS